MTLRLTVSMLAMLVAATSPLACSGASDDDPWTTPAAPASDAALGQEAGESATDAGTAPDASGKDAAKESAPPEADSSSPGVDCSAIAAHAGWQLCQATATTCEAVFSDSSGCAAVCAAAGLSCAQSHEDVSGQCAADTSLPPLACAATGHKSDYCVCGKASSCTPDCSGKVCGSDGCGGACGTCAAGDGCNGGQCAPLSPVQVWLVGDSTVAPGTGWGDSFQAYLSPKAKVINRGRGGRSSKSYYEESDSYWSKHPDAVMKHIAKGDYVLIQFGHNDEKDDAERHTEPGSPPDYAGSFRQYLERYLADAMGKGATPLLITPVSRMKFEADGSHSRTHGEYPAAMKETASTNGVVLLDLEESSHQRFDQLGKAQTLAQFSDGSDLTHFPQDKAWRVAEMLATLLRDSSSPLGAYFK